MSDVKEETPVEIAVSRHCSGTEVFNLLSEYIDVSDTLKLDLLAKLIDVDSDSDNAEEFKKTLCSLPLDLVG